MGRIRMEIRFNGHGAWTLFDTGSRNSYTIPAVARGLPTYILPTAYHVSLGGSRHQLRKMCKITAKLEGKPIFFDAFIIDDIGKDEEGKEIQILFGALDMQRWGIRPVPDKEKLDLSNYSREFIEY